MPTARPPGRPARISRRQVVDEAMALVDADGLDALTMRALARRLGVDPMTVYRHVRDKDDLLGAMCDGLLANLAALALGEPWRPQVSAWATELHERLVARPALLPVLVGAPVTPSAVETAREIVELLLRNGLPADVAAAGINAVFSYVIGFGVVEAAAPAPGGRDDRAEMSGAEAVAAALLDEPGDFGLGLELIVEGIAQRAAQ